MSSGSLKGSAHAPRLRPLTGGVLLTLLLLGGGGCGTTRVSDWLRSGGPEETQRIDLVAVIPIREVPGRAEARDKASGRRILEDHAGRAVTAQVYGYLAEQTRYRFVPDLSVDAFLEELDYRDPALAAPHVVDEFDADAALFGTVYRFQDRVGTRYAASQPASVSFELALYSRAAGEVVWRGQFDETQEALSSNFLNAWMFWRAGPHWFSARELAGLGVEKLLRGIPRGKELQPVGEAVPEP
jgi:hypothetical protein